MAVKNRYNGYAGVHQLRSYGFIMKFLRELGILIFGILLGIFILWILYGYSKINPEIKIIEILSLLVNIIIAIFISIIFYKHYNESRIEKDYILQTVDEIRHKFISLKNMTIQMLFDARKINNLEPQFREALQLLPNKSDSSGQSYLDYERMCTDEVFYLNALIEKSSFREREKKDLKKDVDNITQYVIEHLQINVIIRDIPNNATLKDIRSKITQSFWEFNLRISEFVFKINRF